MNLPKRKPTRLKAYEYSQNGYYFITICTNKHRSILSTIVGQGLAPAECHLSKYGKIAEREMLALEQRYACVKIDKYVIMPNHIHAIIAIENTTAGASPCPTLSHIVCAFKSLTTRKCRQENPIDKLFQTSFHDHIIRGEKDYSEIWEYIENNPTNWETDCFYTE